VRVKRYGRGQRRLAGPHRSPSHRSQTDAIAVAGLDDSSASGSGHERDGDAAPPPPETFVLAPGVFRYLASQQTLGCGSAKRQCRARQQRVRSMGARWRDPVPKPYPAVSGGVDQSPNTRNSMTK
jgi:hypothetical protein